QMEFFLQKMTDIHLRSSLQGEIEPNGDILYVYIFLAIVIFILAIACINFMNLSTARSAGRAREVGTRKVFGAYRINLINQFLTESLVITVVSLFIALILVYFALPYFSNISGKELEMKTLINGTMITGILFLVIFTGVIAGSYPAFFLSAFQPIRVLRGTISMGMKSSGLRKSLVIFQFAISVILMISTGIILSQINFMQNKELGFDKNNVMVAVIQTPDISLNPQTVLYELSQNPYVSDVTISTGVPSRTGELRLFVPEGSDAAESHAMTLLRCDYDYIKTYKMEIVAGRDFSADIGTDSISAFIINETAAKDLFIQHEENDSSETGSVWSPEEAVGKRLDT
ncbi:FtsX-like permease family protein, partial [candidate division KSB1 bacterium]